MFAAHWDRFRPAIKQGWREVADEGSGLFFDLGPHLIDQALILFGRPDTIQADIETQRRSAQVDDYFQVTLFYGKMRAVLSSTLVAAPRSRFELHGTGGSFVKHGLDPQEAQLKEGAAPVDIGFGHERGSDGVFTNGDGRSEIVSTGPGRYLSFYAQLADAIVAGAPVPVDSVDARDGLRVLELARRSHREGKVVPFA